MYKERLKTLENEIENGRYRCRLRVIDMLTDDEVKTARPHDYFIPEEYKESHLEKDDRFITISFMINLYANARPFEIISVNDTKQIYDFIHEYLSIKSSIVESSLNVVEEKIDKLILMDDFAQTLYPHTTKIFKPNEQLNGFKKLTKMRTRGEMMGYNDAPAMAEPPPRISIAEYILSNRGYN